MSDTPESPKPGPRYYRPDKHERNADGEPISAHIGVPLRDLTEEEFAALPAWQQAEIDASDLYQRSKPAAPAPEAPAVPRRQKKEE